MDKAMYAFGVLHAVAYLAIGMIWGFVVIFDFAARKAGIARSMVEAYLALLKQRRNDRRENPNG